MIIIFSTIIMLAGSEMKQALISQILGLDHCVEGAGHVYVRFKGYNVAL